jgi:hypothetical protein
MKNIFFILLFLFSFFITKGYSQELYWLKGNVIDAKTKKTLPNVIVRIQNTQKGTLTDDSGNFQLYLTQGHYDIQFSIVGYEREIIHLSLEKNETISVELAESFVQLTEVLITAEDPGVGIIRRAIANKRKWMDRLQSYQCKAYTKQIMLKDDSIASITESLSNKFWKKFVGFRERIYQKQQTQNIKVDQNFAMVGTILNFNEDVIELAGYKFTGPTAPDALSDYDFKLLRTYESKGYNIYEIKVIPNSKYKPLFEGTICISDSVYAITTVELNPSDVFKIPLIDSFIVNYSQRFDLFDSTYWMPIDIEISGKMQVNFPGLKFPAIGIKQRSILNDYMINIPIDDSIFNARPFVQDTTNIVADSSFWERERTLPLSYEEEIIYETIDSTQTLDKQFQPSGPLMALEGDGFMPFSFMENISFSFNRVEGYFLGLNYDDKIYENLSSSSFAGYSFSDKKFKYSIGMIYKFRKLYNSVLKFNVFDKVTDRLGIYSYGKSEITLYSIFAKEDYGDYYSNKGFDIFYSISPHKNVTLNILYTNEKETSVANNAGHGFFSSKPFRENHNIIDGQMNTIDIKLDLFDIFRLDEREFIRVEIGDRIPTISLGLETSGKFLASDFTFTRYTFEGNYMFPTFLRSLLLKPYISLNVKAGYSIGDLPPQKIINLTSAYYYYAPFGSFRTLRARELLGNHFFEFHIEHNFRTIPFKMLNLTWIEKHNLELLLFASVGKTWIKEETKEIMELLDYTVYDHFYSEIGIGISKIYYVLRTDLAWRISKYNKNALFVTFRLGNIL